MEEHLDRTRWGVGTRVRVKNRFTGSWASGFEIERSSDELEERGYIVRRISDGFTLPVVFRDTEVQREG